MSLPPSLPQHPASRGFPAVLTVLLVLNIVPELLLQLSDYGIIGPDFLRPLAYHLGAFQNGLLTGPGPAYPGHNLLMFFTYGFLHTGFLHLAVNMLGLVWLGRIILSYRTTETFIIIYLMSMVGAAEVFVLIGPEGGNLAGASGALFGLLGVYAVDHKLILPRSDGEPPVVKISWLIAATVVLAVADILGQYIMGTAVAWQAHSGGFLTGALIALISPPRYAAVP